jgi:hypothetical protein
LSSLWGLKIYTMSDRMHEAAIPWKGKEKSIEPWNIEGKVEGSWGPTRQVVKLLPNMCYALDLIFSTSLKMGLIWNRNAVLCVLIEDG